MFDGVRGRGVIHELLFRGRGVKKGNVGAVLSTMLWKHR